MDKKDISKMNTSTLAYLGDAVFEVIVREKIVTEKPGLKKRNRSIRGREITAPCRDRRTRILASTR